MVSRSKRFAATTWAYFVTLVALVVAGIAGRAVGGVTGFFVALLTFLALLFLGLLATGVLRVWFRPPERESED